jgi:hypothetical protein
MAPNFGASKRRAQNWHCQLLAADGRDDLQTNNKSQQTSNMSLHSS